MQSTIPFTKMHGLGNDFVVVDARECDRTDWAPLARAMCDRHFGIGADQLLLVCGSRRADLTMRLFNVDGFEAEMCGNGIRCVGKFVYENDIVRKPEMAIETLGGIKRLRLHVEDEVVASASVAMGVPRLLFEDRPVTLETGSTRLASLRLTGVDLGNPHAVAFVAEPVERFALEQIGPLVENHPMFPLRTNFEIVKVNPQSASSASTLDVRVWERSAGITLACGTGACAAVAAARVKGLVGDRVDVRLPGGTLGIEWDGAGEIYMSGPAATVFDGEYRLH